MVHNVAYGNTVTGWGDASTTASAHYFIFGNLFHGNGGNGLSLACSTTVAMWFHANNVYYGNSLYGLNLTAAFAATIANNTKIVDANNAFGGNTSGARNNVAAGAAEVTLTGDPCTNAASGDFTLNSTAGAGAACRGVGWPSALPYPGSGRNNYPDIGALQHADSGGSSTVVAVQVTNVMRTEGWVPTPY